jgi:hypothetical protein
MEASMGMGGKRTGPKPPKDRNRDPRAPAIPVTGRPDKAALVEKMREAAKRREAEGADKA